MTRSSRPAAGARPLARTRLGLVPLGADVEDAQVARAEAAPTPDDDLAAVVTTVGATAGAVAGWSVRTVAVPAGWVASLALAGTTED